MFIGTTASLNRTTGERDITHRLVESSRVGSKVRQVTLLNLGWRFLLDKAHWPALGQRLDQLLSGQQALVPQSVPESVERCAPHCFARLGAQGGGQISAVSPGSAASPPEFAEVYVESLALTQPRSIGVEHVALAAMRALGFESLLASLGINAVMRTAIVASFIARMAMPGSELASHRWLLGTSDSLNPASSVRIGVSSASVAGLRIGLVCCRSSGATLTLPEQPD